MQSWGDNFIPVVPVDYIEHTKDRPFCWNDRCICREDQEAIGKLNQAVQDGLITAEDADRIYHGRTV